MPYRLIGRTRLFGSRNVGSRPAKAIDLINYPFAVARLVSPPKFAENGLFTAHKVESVPFGNLSSFGSSVPSLELYFT